MRKIIVFNNITLDGYFSGPKGEYDWFIQDPELARQSQETQGSVDTFMFGRVTYDIMSSFWPTPAAKAANPAFADILNNAKKIVFSRSLKKADWQKTEIVDSIGEAEIRKLKQAPGANIMIFGSGSIVNQLTDLGLIDEYQLVLNPVALGKGIPMFKDLQKKAGLKLLEAKPFKSGIVLLRYKYAAG